MLMRTGGTGHISGYNGGPAYPNKKPFKNVDSNDAVTIVTHIQGNPMFCERSRLSTYYYEGKLIWPKSNCIKPDELANSGFYYLCDSDRVSCPWCNIILRDWSVGDSAMAEHKRHSQQCGFLLQPETCGNVLLRTDKKPTLPSNDPNGPKHPQFADLEARLKTFEDSHLTQAQSPNSLAESGFFWAGRDDYVRCFYCDGGLRDWSTEDNSWKEHARWFPDCGFVKSKKGDHFLESARRHSSANEDSATLKNKRLAAARMDTPLVKVVIGLGYDERLVRTVIEQHLLDVGDDFEDATSLMDAVFSYEEKIKKSKAGIVGEVPQSSLTVPLKKTTSSSECHSKQNDASRTDKKFGQSNDLKTLEEQVMRMKEQKMCKICWDDSVSIVFTPCGHMATCSKCADQVTKCPICRLAIKGRIRVFLS